MEQERSKLMTLRELSTQEFTNFEKAHELSNFYQTVSYAMLMAENGYDYDLIGLVDDDNNILASSMILLKPIGIKCYYGYAPRGFLIDYNNKQLVEDFTQKLKEYYYDKNVIFIKLNPNIITGEVNTRNFSTTYNSNKELINYLKNLGYHKLKDNLYFESQLPRFNAIINLQEFNHNNLVKNTKNKIKKGVRKGLIFSIYDKSYLDIFNSLAKDNNNYYFKDFYTVFEKNDNIDLFLVTIDYEQFLENSQYMYNKELERNTKLNEKLTKNNNNKTINAKMNSDKVLLSYKNDIMEATKGIRDNEKIYLAGALVVKHNNKVNIIASRYDKKYKRFVPNYFLYYNIIKYYQNNYDFLDLNGFTGDFTQENPYHGLNRFKLGFNPNIYEYLGEFDLVIEPKSYEILLRNNVLAKEFNKIEKK